MSDDKKVLLEHTYKGKMMDSNKWELAPEEFNVTIENMPLTE